MQLKKALQNAEPGSYIVTQQSKNYELLFIREHTPSYVTIEEISVPLIAFERHHTTWKKWFESGAVGHTLWTISKINVTKGRFESSYSYTHQKWMDVAHESSFLSTLLNLSFDVQPEHLRKRIGRSPLPGQADTRPFWQPKAICEGIVLSQVKFTPYQGTWPSDGSDLSNKVIEIYLPDDKTACPSFFPYWIEIEGKIGSAKARVVETGKNGFSPKLSPFESKRS